MPSLLLLLLVSFALPALAWLPNALPNSGPVNSSGFGTFIEGASVDVCGDLYATHFRDSQDETPEGNSANRNVIGMVDARTGETSAFFVGQQGSEFNGMRWSPCGRYVYLADPGRGRVVRVTIATMQAEDHCGADDSLVGTGAPNDLALAQNGMIYLSGQDFGASTGGLWLCKEDGTTLQLDSSNRTNGIALSPRDDFLYLTEAVGGPVPLNDVPGTQVINRYRVNGETGEVSDKTVFYDFATNPPEPEATIDSDGMRTDTAGNLWVTRNGAGEVVVLTPEAALKGVVSLNQTVNPTNLAFVGRKAPPCSSSAAATAPASASAAAVSRRCKPSPWAGSGR